MANLSEDRYRELLDQATVDCYNNEEEQLMSILYTLEEQLDFPLNAQILGEQVELLGLDDRASNLRRGIVARVRKGGVEYRVGLSELAFVGLDPASAEWLEMYRRWTEL
ncbi:MAG: hypothetical protein CVU38_07975, partial [Chloroflexi bacterium HGW-Chloroflexi-1]